MPDSATMEERKRRALIAGAASALSLLVSGCVFYPRTVAYYDFECEIHARRLVLESQVMADMCSGASGGHEAAVACLAVLAGVTAGSAAVSGSIVVVGNTAYWFEKRGRCLRKSTLT
jgi:hypothetical protein